MTKYQTQVIIKMLEANAYPGTEEICRIASLLSTSKKRIERFMYKVRAKKRADGVLLKGENCSVTHTHTHTVTNSFLFHKFCYNNNDIWQSHAMDKLILFRQNFVLTATLILYKW